jgi:hypothetical protein
MKPERGIRTFYEAVKFHLAKSEIFIYISAASPFVVIQALQGSDR